MLSKKTQNHYENPIRNFKKEKKVKLYLKFKISFTYFLSENLNYSFKLPPLPFPETVL